MVPQTRGCERVTTISDIQARFHGTSLKYKEKPVFPIDGKRKETIKKRILTWEPYIIRDLINTLKGILSGFVP